MPYMKDKGDKQGDMKPVVDNYQRPDKCYAEKQFGKTVDYIARKDKQESKEASKLRNQSFNGRYN